MAHIQKEKINLGTWMDVPKDFTGTVGDSKGCLLHFKNGELHNVGAPAAQWANGATEWYLFGRRHRVGGPAVSYKDGMCSYYIDGQRVNKNEHDEIFAALKK